MGSTGSGNFSDYSGRSGQSGNGGGASGGSSGGDQCGQAFTVGLEDVGDYDFFTTTDGVPPQGTVLEIVLSTRVVAVTGDGLVIGALPTSKNYIAACLADGYSYAGVVRSSSLDGMPQVQVDIVPNAPQ
ncbi:MAG: hypothetical protein ABJN39_00100 [Sulfitobacter sp.]|uniref:hypothetical protein n=1 Tax=Alphaproteobacteria TaxID=28211 RepID=UPI002942BD2D|nr:hypothetical protein [Sulfitobacter sp. LC.270.F.C4]WOI14869.1 hypothetical protein R1T45_17620 [Sulfitobacter sp. LC.270.F.C4]